MQRYIVSFVNQGDKNRVSTFERNRGWWAWLGKICVKLTVHSFSFQHVFCTYHFFTQTHMLFDWTDIILCNYYVYIMNSPLFVTPLVSDIFCLTLGNWKKVVAVSLKRCDIETSERYISMKFRSCTGTFS